MVSAIFIAIPSQDEKFLTLVTFHRSAEKRNRQASDCCVRRAPTAVPICNRPCGNAIFVRLGAVQFSRESHPSFRVQCFTQRPSSSLALVLIVGVEEHMHDVRLARQSGYVLRDFREFAFVIVVVEPLRRRREPLLVPGAVVASVQAHHRQSRFGYFPYRRYRAGDALRLVDDNIDKPVVALEGQRPRGVPLRFLAENRWVWRYGLEPLSGGRPATSP